MSKQAQQRTIVNELRSGSWKGLVRVTMDDHVEHVKCLICKGEDTEVFVRGTGAAQLVRCRKDGLVYRDPRPKADYLKEFQSTFVSSDQPGMV
jgi:hypothetical protein